jgi:hypothetical protein
MLLGQPKVFATATQQADCLRTKIPPRRCPIH